MVTARANAIRQRSVFSRLIWRGLFAQRLDAATGLLDRRRSALGRNLHFKSRLGLPFAHTQNFDAVAPTRNEPRLHQALDGDELSRVELAGVDRPLNAVEVHHVVIKPGGGI